MAVELLGTDYGGWLIDLGLIPRGSTIISAGVGEDISFDLELINRLDCHVVGIDPTPKSHRFIENQVNLTKFDLLKKALTSKDDDIIKIYKNTNPHHVSESQLLTHNAVSRFDHYYAETINLETIFKKYDNVSLVKMDIEGSEFDVIEKINFIPDSVMQLCIEFHHFCSHKTLEDTRQCIEIIKNFGFKTMYQKNGKNDMKEITFIR